MQQNDILYENETKKTRKNEEKKNVKEEISSEKEVSAQNYRISNFLYKVVLDI